MHLSRKLILIPLAFCVLSLGKPAFADQNQELATMQQFIKLMQGYYDIIESTHAVSSDAEKSAIQHMQKIKEFYDERGEAARTVPVLRDVLANTTNSAVRNAATMLLSETLKETGRSDEAIEVLIDGLQSTLEEAG
ncbi:MAG: hypothetical protein AAF270_00455 [Pseudomonadota bacterium]